MNPGGITPAGSAGEAFCPQCSVSFRNLWRSHKGLCSRCWQERRLALRRAQREKMWSPLTPSARANRLRSSRLRDASVRGGVPPEVITALQAGYCVYCGASAAHADHVRPLSRGGWHDPENMASACETCNISKGNRLLLEWDWVRVVHGCWRSRVVRDALLRELTGSADAGGRVLAMEPVKPVRSASVRGGSGAAQQQRGVLADYMVGGVGSTGAWGPGCRCRRCAHRRW